ncbi:hypothetical protein IAR50_007378 [Cryptococcus sp. DSM 104548]
MSTAHDPPPEDDFDDDDFPAAPGGKKRKVPAYGQLKSPDELEHHHNPPDSSSALSTSSKTAAAPAFPLKRKFARTFAYALCEFRKGLFLRRKAAFIALYIDAQAAINATSTAAGATGPAAVAVAKYKASLPDVTNFEKLLPALEDVGVNSWTPDRPGWREDRAEEWRVRPRKRKAGGKRVERKGWAPEGSFEFEKECKASTTLRSRVKEQGALLKLAYELRGIVLATHKPTSVVKSTTVPPAEDKPPSKNKRKIDRKHEASAPIPASGPVHAPALVAPTPATDPTSTPVPAQRPASPAISQTISRDEDGKPKKKPKKKKRSVLANQGNPHHVDNYRPSRTVSPQGDPFEPYAYHFDLISPPSMRFLATRPERVTAPLPGAPQKRTLVRPSEDDYVCCFCEYDLYYGSERARRRAIRSRKAELKRKEAIKTKAKNVAEGRGTFKNESDEEDEEDEDEEGCEDDGHGHCT